MKNLFIASLFVLSAHGLLFGMENNELTLPQLGKDYELFKNIGRQEDPLSPQQIEQLQGITRRKKQGTHSYIKAVLALSALQELPKTGTWAANVTALEETIKGNLTEKLKDRPTEEQLQKTLYIAFPDTQLATVEQGIERPEYQVWKETTERLKRIEQRKNTVLAQQCDHETTMHQLHGHITQVEKTLAELKKCSQQEDKYYRHASHEVCMIELAHKVLESRQYYYQEEIAEAAEKHKEERDALMKQKESLSSDLSASIIVPDQQQALQAQAAVLDTQIKKANNRYWATVRDLKLATGTYSNKDAFLWSTWGTVTLPSLDE